MRSNMQAQLIDGAQADLEALGQNTFMQDLGARYRAWAEENKELNAASEQMIRVFERVAETHGGPTAAFDALCESELSKGVVPQVLVRGLQRELEEMAAKRDLADLPLMTMAWFSADPKWSGGRGGLYGWLSEHNLGVRGRRDLTSCVYIH